MEFVLAMLRRFSDFALRALIVLAVLVVSGAGSISVQLCAWATMLPSELVETGSLSEAVGNTFSGNKPCSMCEAAEALQHQDSSGDAPVLSISEKLHDKPVTSGASMAMFVPRALYVFLKLAVSDDAAWVTRRDSPDSPPPQAA